MLRLARVGILVLLAMAGLSAAGPAPSIVEAVKSGDRGEDQDESASESAHDPAASLTAQRRRC